MLRWACEHADGIEGARFAAWSVTNANADLKDACKALGIPPCSTNDLRRTYATWLGQAGVRDELIELALGHKGKSVLARHYRKLTGDDLLRLMQEDIAAHQPPVRASADAPVRTSDDLRTGEVGPAGLEPATYGLKVRSSTD